MRFFGQKMHRNCFTPGLHHGHRWESYNASPGLLVNWRRGFPLLIPFPLQCNRHLDVRYFSHDHLATLHQNNTQQPHTLSKADINMLE